VEIGIVGLPQSGKSTLFEIMTGINSRLVHGEKLVRGQAEVPDGRLTRLAAIYQPERVAPAKLPFLDAQAAGEKKWETLRQVMAGVDGLLHVVDGFTLPEVEVMAQSYRQLMDELILADLAVVENRREKLSALARKGQGAKYAREKALLDKTAEFLESGKPLRQMGLGPEEKRELKGYGFWTIKPELVVLNLGETAFSPAESFRALCPGVAPLLAIAGLWEAELMALAPAEREDYLRSLGLAAPAYESIIQGAFAALGLSCFFTVGPDEVRAWVIPQGSRAPQAAGVIHQDFARGFIKAEVIGYEDFLAAGESMNKAKSLGKVRLEGKEYVVGDGDIITFRFNV
jgi:GTP-binding protein YchF